VHDVLRGAIQVLGGVLQLLALAADGLDHLPQVALHVGQGPLQLAGFIVTLHVDGAAQVALGDGAGHGDGLAQRAQHGLHQVGGEQAEQQADQDHAADQQPGGLFHRRFAVAAGLGRMLLDQPAEGLVLLFQFLEGLVEGRHLRPRGRRVGQRQFDDALGLGDVVRQCRLRLGDRLLDVGAQRQGGIVLQRALEPLAVIVEVGAHLADRAAVAGLDIEGGQYVGTQGVVHHVAFQVIAQGADAEFVLGQGSGQAHLPPEAQPAKQGSGEHADGAAGDHFLADVHAAVSVVSALRQA